LTSSCQLRRGEPVGGGLDLSRDFTTHGAPRHGRDGADLSSPTPSGGPARRYCHGPDIQRSGGRRSGVVMQAAKRPVRDMHEPALTFVGPPGLEPGTSSLSGQRCASQQWPPVSHGPLSCNFPEWPERSVSPVSRHLTASRTPFWTLSAAAIMWLQYAGVPEPPAALSAALSTAPPSAFPVAANS
jgi:hypothetical protein